MTINIYTFCKIISKFNTIKEDFFHMKTNNKEHKNLHEASGSSPSVLSVIYYTSMLTYLYKLNNYLCV